ncbi:SIMPL domain-containing protein [Pusillimonas sp. MFBS29]|uniref:SIMPL domain-containing protein n=1 Tax=Pusillimonas sp. MFBS29 TaxID=2886690 RepID=UPI001D1022F4|nr:SIMPL domain-containing protein [Pusillimonas sp. MFBS29]MCC2596877.1 SIMPL domain-containing protein [Pusillimonas sp. MFBS29]
MALGLSAGVAALPAVAQPPERAGHHHVHQKWPQAQLQAEANAEIAQDTVKITLAAELSDATQTAVADALTKVLEDTMKQAKAGAQGKTAIKISSGNYRIWPMNNKDGKITNWRGRAEILLESTDLPAASELASSLSDRMPIDNLRFFVSPQARAEKEAALLEEAVKAFRDRAQALTQAFGFASYSIKEINLGGSGARYESAPRMMAMAADKASVPLEGGTEMVSVAISGSIFFQQQQK